ncbi:MAG: HAMP domain-containing sensor histidine kinase [Proteobacteria bacterium]|nr:HAMP domain-containing sensor histidine kinase [Pseudomonadota bacterium]
MTRLFKWKSIITQIYILAFLSLFVGFFTTFIWVSSENNWKEFIKNSYHAGISLYNNIKYNNVIDEKIKITKIDKSDEVISREELDYYSKIPIPNKLTTISIFDNRKKNNQQEKIIVHLISEKLRYPISKITPFSNLGAEQQLGKLIELIANYCTNPILFIKINESFWYRVDGNDVWGCKVAPSDNRLLTIIFLFITIFLIYFLIRDNQIMFDKFIINLKNNLRTSKGNMDQVEGHSELENIKTTLDEFLKLQKDKLEKRLMVLSSISHDIGTPATKIKLRTSLIEDQDLKKKLEDDIDNMIEMMDGVLSYTRSEMDLEEEIEISYISLIESIVFDYQDLGKRVSFIKPKENSVGFVSSIFTGKKKNRTFQLKQNHHLLVNAKPLSLKRAITNLIENALKYGRTATLSLEFTSQKITLIVEDEGKNISDELLETLKKPFIRGENTKLIKGTGLGLTIVATIAEQHGGNLTFEKSKIGTRAKLMIKR